MTTEEFIRKASITHGDKYRYDNTVYTKSGNKVIITCPTHGDFMQEANAHANKGQGCPKCGTDKRKSSISKKFNTERFITISDEIHQGKYCYDKVVYVKNNTSVTITCPIHGDFEQEPKSHLVGNGCKKCALANNNYWSYSGWTLAGENSKYFDGYKVYVIRCYSDTEEFYKIGKTYNPIWLRFNRGQLPYEYEVLHTFTGSGLFICKLEEELLKMNYEYRYKPTKKFAGSQECFSSLEGVKEKLYENK